MTAPLPLLHVAQLAVRYPGKTVVQDLSFSLEPGEIGCLLGASGCGKTTALRAIAGFENPSAGEILLDGWSMADSRQQMPPEKRRIGMVFQDFALFPHLDVASNIGFGLGHLPTQRQQERVAELLQLVGLEDRGDSYPHQLSGGQQQRIALARALAPKPRLLLLDEPFSSLDSELRAQLADEVRCILKREGITSLLVTHDQHEAFAMADRIGVMHQGRLEQWAEGYQLYHAPATPFIANFIGEGVLLTGQADGSDRVSTPVGPVRIAPEQKPQGPVHLLLRPDDVRLDQQGTIPAQVTKRAFRGAEYLYTLQLSSGEQLLSLMPSHCRVEVGTQCHLQLCQEPVPVFPLSA